jgi:hypothetical protein
LLVHSCCWLLAGSLVTAMAADPLMAGKSASGSPNAKRAYKGTADDFVEINQLFARYDYTIDNHDGVAWAANFTPDGVFRDPSWCAIGREQLTGVVGTKPAIGGDEEHHHVPAIGPITYQDRDHATVHSTVMLVAEKGPGHPDGGIIVTGTYDDTLLRYKGEWLFAYRLVHRPSATASIPCVAQPPYEAARAQD